MAGDGLRDKLRRLRREGGEPPARDEPARRKQVPVWLRKRMEAQARRASASAGGAADVPGSARSLDEPLRLDDRDGPGGRFAERIDRFPEEHEHGTWRLDDIDHAADDFALLARDPALASIDLRDAVYLDIETTGLSGGAGTIPFLVALGTFNDGAFELWQGFMRGPENERAMLHDVAERVGARSAVVSFFGKSFDRHRLEDKMRLHGIAPPFADRPHLDLFHPLARLYREAFDDARLCTMERELCGLQRHHDLPGSFAPEAWFDFVAGRPHRLEAVFQHNADDVLSLVVLAAHLGRTLCEERSGGRPLGGPDWTRARGLARLFADRRERPRALTWVERALQRDPDSDGGEQRRWQVMQADLWRLDGAWERALEAYERLAADHVDELAAHCWLERAKLHEHRRRDLDAAWDCTQRARTLLATGVRGRGYARLERAARERSERLAARR